MRKASIMAVCALVLLLSCSFVAATDSRLQQATDPSYRAPTTTEIEKLTNLVVKVINQKLSCEVCQGLEKSLDLGLDAFFAFWQPAGKQICEALSKQYKMSADNCFEVMKRYIPGIKTSFRRLATHSKDTFLCGYVLGVCDSPNIKKVQVGPILKELYADKPSVKEPVPTGRATYKIIQINDPHIDLFYTEGAVENCTGSVMCCRSDSKAAAGATTGSAGYWGSHTYGSCDLPVQTFRDFIRFARDTIKPDVVMWLGDNEHHEIDQVTKDYNFKITKLIADELRTGFPEADIQFSIGNHESFPVDNTDISSLKNPKDEWFFAEFTSAYASLLSEEQMKFFKTRGYYSGYNKKLNARFINLLSIPMDTYNFFMLVQEYDSNGMFRWMWNEMREAEKNGEHIYITLHIPPGLNKSGSDGTFQLFDELFNASVERFRNNVRGIFTGHTHTDMLRWTRERANPEKVVMTNFIGPSLTTFGGMQPSFRVYEVDADTGVIVDLLQYRLHLDKWNQQGSSAQPVWDLVYSFKNAYGLKDMSTASMQSLYDNLMQVNQPYFNTYLANHESGRQNNAMIKAHPKTLPSNQSDAYLYTRCNFHTEVRLMTMCLGTKIFSDYKGNLFDIFMANMYNSYMQFLN